MAEDDDLPDLDELDPDIRARLVAVQAKLTAMENDLGDLIGAELAAVRTALEAAAAEPDSHSVHLSAISEAVHHIKGVAGSFGFPLVSDVAANLQVYPKRSAGAPARVLPVVEAHLRALRRHQGTKSWRRLRRRRPDHPGLPAVAGLTRERLYASVTGRELDCV
jgi:HPt (histidine-containing phosphotransfer) domain-containing protein